MSVHVNLATPTTPQEAHDLLQEVNNLVRDVEFAAFWGHISPKTRKPIRALLGAAAEALSAARSIVFDAHFPAIHINAPMWGDDDHIPLFSEEDE